MSPSTKYLVIVHILIFGFFGNLYAQNTASKFIKTLTLFSDTVSVVWPTQQIDNNGDHVLPFNVTQNDMELTVRLVPTSNKKKITFELLNTNSYKVSEPLLFVNDQYYSGKIQFNSIFQSTQHFLDIAVIDKKSDTDQTIIRIPLIPIYNTQIAIYPKSKELYQGDIKSFPIVTNNQGNILETTFWSEDRPIDYRIIKENGKASLQVRSNKLGKFTLTINANLRFPRLVEEQLMYQTDNKSYSFEVKKTRLKFLNFSKNIVFFDPSFTKKNQEFEMEYVPSLKIGKTYRLEGQKAPGGPLIAELYIRELLDNGRVMCYLRTYGLHFKKNDYLYIKDNDAVKFITNFKIIPQVSVQEIQILRPNKDWIASNIVHPGEDLEIKLIGNSLRQTWLYFEGLETLKMDTTRSKDAEVIFKGNIPLNILRKSSTIMFDDIKSTKSLLIKEHQVPQDLGFVTLSASEKTNNLNTNGLIMVPYNSEDIKLLFDKNRIDEKSQLYGKQYFDIKLEIRSDRSQLIDQAALNHVTICPGPKSKRFKYYDPSDCYKLNSLSFNSILHKKIYQLPPWSSVQLTISHDNAMYNIKGVNQKFNIILQQKIGFDIDVSFPAGLVVKKAGEDGFGNLGGISLAIVAQFSFFHPTKVNQKKPYKIGAGFLAFDAFNFSANATNRDVGAVILGSIYPIQRYERRKLSFPLYLGGGYFLSQEKWFLLFGPGIRIRL